MKRFLLSNILILISFLYISGQNITVQISGTVTDAGNGSPVVNQPVNIMTDSMSGTFYYNQVYTNNQGVYSDAVSVPANLQVVFYIGTLDCNGNYQMQTGVSTNSPIIADFSICTGGPTSCDALFYAVPDSSNPSGIYNYSFWDVSLGNPTAWAWDFGDGTTSNLQNPVHTYQLSGTYFVCLTITTATGCTSTYCNYVYVGQIPFCYANFNYYVDSTGYGVQFMDASAGNPTDYLWDFGDGTTSNLQYPYHVFNGPGPFWVCLTISGNNCQNTYCNNVYLSGGQGCMAQFWAVRDSSTTDTWMFFDISLGNVINWAWSFGDGTSSNQQNPTHIYGQTGTYLVCLTILTSDSCISTYCDSIYTGTNPITCYSYFTYNSNGLSLSFDAWSFGGTAPYTYTWDFGDGTTSTLPNPVHTYASSGNYVVTLTGNDAAGCSSTYTTIVYVSNGFNGTIWGQVFAGNTVLDQGWAFLYVDAGPANPMMLIDSAMIDSIGHYYFIILNPLPGIYYTKAAPSPNSVFYNDYLPTYYGNTVFWTDATPIDLVQPANPYDINLVPLIGPQPGNGNINGQVTSDGKFSAALTIPAADIEVMLLNMSNNPLAVDYSDNLGNFSFNNLAMGTYKIYAEITGLPTSPAVVTLSTANPSVNNLTLVITPDGITTGIENNVQLIMAINKLYPNPVKDNVTVEFALLKASVMEVSLMNILGETVTAKAEEFSAGNHRVNIQLEDLKPGTYFLQLNNAEGTKLTRKITMIK